jgi:hypothetical protein
VVVQITAPVGLDFGFCTVNEESARTFELVNVGQVHTSNYIPSKTHTFLTLFKTI